MSKGLDYLIQVRGEALLPYFQFLKEAGKHLDVKTKDLISVITKVDAQTEKGLKQYLNRALRDGCSADEIIDALLMAFPTLGLTKIIWAINIILAMDLPDFRAEALGHKPAWNKIAPMNDIRDNGVSYWSVGPRNLFVFRENNELKVYDSHCPHRSEDIKLEALDDLKLMCPRHKWVFDMKTGECIEKGSHPLRAFESKVEDNVLYAFW